mmetsp:Transcript_8376/g.16437  ORF Transcript_8376/g.16437 Transcript_8376/m.16437 type:complete len:144 (-) Transcript_8376:89-520(-)
MSEPVSELPKFEENKTVQRLLLVHYSSFHQENFMRFELHGIEVGASVLPVTDVKRAVSLVKRLVRAKKTGAKVNSSSSQGNMDDCLLTTVMTVPGIPKKEASAILEQHESIAGVVNYYCGVAACGGNKVDSRVKKVNKFFTEA